jgi:hypothetical protein
MKAYWGAENMSHEFITGVYRFWRGNLRKGDHLEELRADERIILK